MKVGIFIVFVLLASVFSGGCEREKTEVPKIEKISGVVREVFDIEKYPALTAVGKVNLIGRQWCSLTLISEDIAVTAGHCLLESNFKFDLTKDLNPYYCPVIFKPNGDNRLENISVKRVLKIQRNPDYAIVKLNKKIPASVIKPLKIFNLSLEEMRSRETKLGCAGFNGDKDLGSDGLLMTISRNIKIMPETSEKDRVDANCYSTYGGSGGLFFEERQNAETNAKEYYFLGVVWGVTDEKVNEKGELIKVENVITSITPVSVFYDELTEILEKN